MSFTAINVKKFGIFGLLIDNIKIYVRKECVMKKVEHYICDVCHTEYNSKCQCQQCEKSHKKTVKVVAAHYISVTQNAKGFPQKIEVEFEGGEVLTYKRG